MGSATLQGQLWSGAAHDWAELQEPTASPLWDAMLDAAGVGRGTRLLDAGCGAGGAGLLAAARGALVNGCDAAPALLAIARQRMPDADFQVGDLEVLPYADRTFDAVIAADVLPYTAQPVAAVRELARVCARPGRVVVATWSAPEECAQRPLLWALRDLLPARLGEEPFALSGLGVLESLLASAGLQVLGSAEVRCPCDYADRETAWRAQVSAGPLQAALRLVGAAHVRRVLVQALAGYTAPAGTIQLVHHFRYVVTVPAGGALPWYRGQEPGKGGQLM